VALLAGEMDVCRVCKTTWRNFRVSDFGW